MNEPEHETEEVDHLLLATMTIREYLEASTGERSLSVETESDLPLSNLIGLLRLAEHWVLSEYGMGGDDDDD